MYPLIRTDCRDTDSIQQRQKGELEYLVFPKLEETGVVEHLFTTRTGGVSNGIYSTMNLSFSRGDDLECVRDNSNEYRKRATNPENPVFSGFSLYSENLSDTLKTHENVPVTNR